MSPPSNPAPGAVGLVLLAAGGSTRMGAPKQLLDLGGHSMVRHAANAALASVCRPVVVVVGANGEKVRAELDGLPVRVVENGDWARGMGTSVRAGVAALDGTWVDAAVLMLCDQPFVTGSVIDALVDAHRGTGRPVAASEYAGSLGVPALFHRSLFPELRAIGPAAGAKQVLARRAAGEVAAVPFAAGAEDVDTPADYQRIAGSAASPEGTAAAVASDRLDPERLG
jgi:molybdenum cofactor cytidylyltransferase